MKRDLEIKLERINPGLAQKIKEVLLVFPEMEIVFEEMLRRKTSDINSGDKQSLERHLDDEERYLMDHLNKYQSE